MRSDGLDAARLRFVDVDGVRTRVYEDGRGEPLVLIHGGAFGTGYSLDAWSLNVPSLAREFSVVAFDRLGQGFTDNPRRDEDMTFEAVVAHTARLLRLLELGPAHVVGHSTGGLLATRLALDYPDLVRSLVVVDSGSTAADDPRYDLHGFYLETEKRVPPGPPTREGVRAEPEAQSWSTEHVTDDFVVRLLEIALLPKTQEMRRRMDIADGSFMAALAPVRARTIAEIEERGLPSRMLLLWGRDDPSAPYPLGLQLFEKIAACTEDPALHVLSRAGHYCFRERPDLFEQLLIDHCLGRGER